MAERTAYILVVDDEEEIRKILTHILEKEGFRVVTAPDGQQTMQQILLEAPDFILLDVCMPGPSGMEILKKIKEIDDVLPVVLITAHADIHQAVEAVREGAYDYLAKPFDNNEVVWIARRALADALAGTGEILRRAAREVLDRSERAQGGNRELDFKYRLTLENFKDAPVTVRVMDRLPVAENETDIRVTLGEMKDKLSEDVLYQGSEEGTHDENIHMIKKKQPSKQPPKPEKPETPDEEIIGTSKE
jgi:DNA-binding response OmpR family regulator